MTISELVVEIMSMEGGETYAGGMTSGDIESIKEESAALRKKMSDKKV
tara:strand:+ start:485 stop:628 length:144 start_codon:yes stop_codon:yes gene_type:complete